jgi:DnaJ-class molecular chaperone
MEKTMSKNHYEYLEIAPTASVEIIKAAAAIKQKQILSKHQRELELLKEAYSTLIDLLQRRNYLNQVKKEGKQGAYYIYLNIPLSADSSKIQQAARKKQEEINQAKVSSLAHLKEAYENLSDKGKRKAYDEHLEYSSPI